MKLRLRPVAVTISLLAVFSVPFGERGSVRADIDGVCVMYCDDSSPTYSTGGGGYGGGGCAAYDPYAYDSAYNRSVGDYHPDHVNVVWNGSHWSPAEGYEWVSDAPDDYRVRLAYGTVHPENSNVYWDSDGWRPYAGYTWYNDEPGDYRTIGPGDSHPTEDHVIWNGEEWEPAPGYAWAYSDGFDLIVVGPGERHREYSNVIWNGDKWTPAEGYIWASQDDDDLRILGPGDDHPDHAHVVWSGERWEPASGYVWENDTPGDYTVISESENDSRLAASEPPSSPVLSIAEVPSPSGYRTAAERQVQLDRMTDLQIDTELARIRSTLVRMQKDFESNVADLEH